MDGGLGGGNGFMFRTRREEDAKAFQDEFVERGRRRNAYSRATLIVVPGILVVLLTLGVLDALG